MDDNIWLCVECLTEVDDGKCLCLLGPVEAHLVGDCEPEERTDPRVADIEFGGVDLPDAKRR